MKYIKTAIIIVILLSMMQSCTKGGSNEIEAELFSHFEVFAAEANEFGIVIDFESMNVGGYIENIQTTGTIGQCRSYSDGSKNVVIDTRYWNRMNDTEREYVVFHELGHCVLGRSHVDTKDQNGNCSSIMQSGEGDCESLYIESNRDELLEELFQN